MKKINRAGYTIVELMIVLGVTGAIAISAFSLVRGQQAKNEFTQAVRDFETKLNDIANDVSKGYFPDIGGNRQCVAPAGADLRFDPPGVSVGQGGSTDCVFAGKILQFNIGSGDESQMNLVSLVARRRTRDDKPVTSLASLANNDLEAAPNLDEPVPLFFGLRAKSVKYNGVDGNNAVVFMSGFANRSNASTNLSGAPVTNLYWLAKSVPVGCNTSFATALRRPECYIAPDPTAGMQGIQICMEHGKGGRPVLFTLGREGRELNVTTEIDTPC